MAVTMLTIEDAEHFTQQIDLIRGDIAQLRKDFDELVKELKAERKSKK